MSKAEFKDSPQLPKGWRLVSLANILRVLYRYPTYYGINYLEDGIPEVRGELILEYGFLDPLPELYRYVSKETAARFPLVRLEPNDFVMSVRGTLGKIGIVPDWLAGAVITANLIRLQFDDSLVKSQWAKHFLLSEIFQNRLDKKTSATTIKTIQAPALKSILVELPPVKEQIDITEILDTADEAIQQTEAVIAKLKQIKAGLLHDLLTCGLDEHGHLRDPIAHPEQFKDSPLGRIPRQWEVDTIQKLALNCDNRRIPLKQEDRDKMQGIYPYYGASGIIDMVDDYIFDGEYILLGEDGENVVSRQLPLAFRASGKFWVNNHAHVYKPLPGVDIRFLIELLEAKDYKPIISGSAQPKLTQHAINKMLFQIPPTEERKRIAEVLEAHDNRIRSEEVYRDKLKQQKKGLMHDLLTGRVRV